MTLMIRRGVLSLLICSTALFLFINIEGDRLKAKASGNLFSSSLFHSDSYLNWFLNPDTVGLLQSIGTNLIPDNLTDLSRTVAITGDILYSLLQATAENISSLADFIVDQNSAIPMDTALIQANAFWKYSIKYELPLDLAIAVAHTESHFNPKARSSAGAAGVMQVMWRVHSGLLQANGIMAEDDLYDPDLGIAAGSLLLSRYLRAYDNTQSALGRYYGGSPQVYWRRVSRNLDTIRGANIIEPSDI